MLTWLKGFGTGKKYVLYCSDVKGAFDRVKRERLLEKLRAKGVPENWVKLFESLLNEREPKAVLGGKLSKVLALKNMVFQGTVWGSMLWNVFYEDSVLSVRGAGCTEVFFADDLNALNKQRGGIRNY